MCSGGLLEVTDVVTATVCVETGEATVACLVHNPTHTHTHTNTHPNTDTHTRVPNAFSCGYWVIIGLCVCACVCIAWYSLACCVQQQPANDSVLPRVHGICHEGAVAFIVA